MSILHLRYGNDWVKLACLRGDYTKKYPYGPCHLTYGHYGPCEHERLKPRICHGHYGGYMPCVHPDSSCPGAEQDPGDE